MPASGIVPCMSVLGHGLDLVEVGHFKALCENKEEQELLDRYFTPGELALVGSGAGRAQRLAGRFAAKEAILKAIGVGWSQDIAWTDIEIGALPSGAPVANLHGVAAELAVQRGITVWLISISHTSTFAAASAIALSDTQ